MHSCLAALDLHSNATCTAQKDVLECVGHHSYCRCSSAAFGQELLAYLACGGHMFCVRKQHWAHNLTMLFGTGMDYISSSTTALICCHAGLSHC